MNNIDPNPLPRIRRFPPNALEQAVERIKQAEPLYRRLLDHQADFRASVAKKGHIKRLREFEATNPLDEWADVTDEPMQQLQTLERQGLIATIKVGDRFYSRPAS